MPYSPPTKAGSDQGLTLIELLVAMVMFAIMAVLSTTGWMSYQRTVQHRSAGQEIASALRNAQQSALAEAVTYCMRFDSANGTYQLFKFTCDGTVPAVKPAVELPGRLSLSGVAFTQANGNPAQRVLFLPRGSATPGDLTIERDGSNKTYTIDVEGLTGRVSLKG